MIDVICIVCPKGCRLRVDEKSGYSVTGNSCKRGEEYAKKEVTAPTRVITSIVRIEGAPHPCCPVKTVSPIPKGHIPAAMELLRAVKLRAPIHTGDIVVKDICGTGVDWVATKDM